MDNLPKTWDDWIANFNDWQDRVGFDREWLGDFDLSIQFDWDRAGDEIEFGDYAGRKKWERSLQVPHQSMRDALVTMITVQGDTEFASVEQQRHLLATAPTDYDRYAAARIMAEEQRHGWQMAYLLMTYFGQQGRREAQKLLERNAQDGDRLLGAFNRPMPHWLDFFNYTMFVDRDGKFQLGMLSTSAFKPLAASMGPMLKEESFHLGTGSNGLRRIIKAGVIPQDMLQRYMNKWVSTAHDLFGVDSSSSAHWAYVWGIKGRWDERKKQDAEMDVDRKSSTRKLVDTITMKSSEKSRNSTATKKKVLHHSMLLTRTSTETSATARECATPFTVRNSKVVTMNGTNTSVQFYQRLKTKRPSRNYSNSNGFKTSH